MSDLPGRPWTREELDRMFTRPTRAMPHFTVYECLTLFHRILQTALLRPLTQEECHLHGQLEQVYQHAVRAEALHTITNNSNKEDDLEYTRLSTPVTVDA